MTDWQGGSSQIPHSSFAPSRGPHALSLKSHRGTQMIPTQSPLQPAASRLVTLPLACRLLGCPSPSHPAQHRAKAVRWSEPQGVPRGPGCQRHARLDVFPLLCCYQRCFNTATGSTQATRSECLPGADPTVPKKGPACARLVPALGCPSGSEKQTCLDQLPALLSYGCVAWASD